MFQKWETWLCAQCDVGRQLCDERIALFTFQSAKWTVFPRVQAVAITTARQAIENNVKILIPSLESKQKNMKRSNDKEPVLEDNTGSKFDRGTRTSVTRAIKVANHNHQKSKCFAARPNDEARGAYYPAVCVKINRFPAVLVDKLLDILKRLAFDLKKKMKTCELLKC